MASVVPLYRPGTTEPMTIPDKDCELLYRAAHDPVLLARLAGVVPDEWQGALLRSKASQMILCCSRQSGKSMATAMLALWTALYKAPALVLILSPGERQSGELFRTVRGLYGRLPLGVHEWGSAPTSRKHMRDGVQQVLDGPAEWQPVVSPILRLNQSELELQNGSRIVALPGTEGTVRSYASVRLMVVDEASRVPDELYQAIRPMLAVSRGRIVLLSTPFCQRGFFWREWDRGVGWERTMVRAVECPRIDPGWLAAERAGMDEWWYQQEYECVFHPPVDQPFPDVLVDAMLEDEGPLEV